MSDQGPWHRVSAVLDQMVAERERHNRDREKAQEADKLSSPEQFIPTARDVNEALQARYGQGMSFRDLGPLVQRYVRENGVLRRLRPRAGQRYQETAEETAEALPKRMRTGVDRVFGALEAQRGKLTHLLADEVALETEALRRHIGALELEVLELQRQLADQAALVDDTDHAREDRAVTLSERDHEIALHTAAKAELAEAQRQAAAAVRERDAAAAAMRAAEETQRATQVRYDELMAHAARLSGELERAGREREEYQRQMLELTASLETAKRKLGGKQRSVAAEAKKSSPRRQLPGTMDDNSDPL